MTSKRTSSKFLVAQLLTLLLVFTMVVPLMTVDAHATTTTACAYCGGNHSLSGCSSFNSAYANLNVSHPTAAKQKCVWCNSDGHTALNSCSAWQQYAKKLEEQHKCAWCDSTAHAKLGDCDDYKKAIQKDIADTIKEICAFCREEGHTMEACPKFAAAGTKIEDAEQCSECGVTISAKINGVDWGFSHNASCPLFKEFWETTVSTPSIENKGSEGIYIDGKLIPGTNYDPDKIGTGGGGVKEDNDQGFSNRKKHSEEAEVLTYPRSKPDLRACRDTVGKNSYYDAKNWKDIMRAGNKDYEDDDTGIWEYSGSKYRIAKVPDPDNTNNTKYVLVRLPADWDSRLVEVNPKAQGNVATPSGSTTTSTETYTSTSSSTNQPKPNNGSNSYNFGGSFTNQTAQPSTNYDSTASGAHDAGARVDGSNRPVGGNSYSDGNGTYSFELKSDGTVKTDDQGNAIINYTTTESVEETVEVEVHYCEYSYYFTDVCKSGSVDFTGDWAYNQGNSGSYNKGDDYYQSIVKPGSGSSSGIVKPGNGSSSSTGKYPNYGYDYDYSDRFDYDQSYNDYQNLNGLNTSNTITADGNTHHVKTTFSCCSSNCGSSNEPHNNGMTTYTDMGPDLHRVEKICTDCGHISVSYAAHPANTEKCPDCGREMGRYVNWHWYDEATPVVTKIWQPYYTTLKYPDPRGRMDYTFTGWYTEWGGVGQFMNPDEDVMYVHVMPKDFYASWAFIIKQDFSAPTITVKFLESYDERTGREGAVITDTNKPVKDMWLKVTSFDLEGHDVEKYTGSNYWGTDPNKQQFYEDPLWSSGLIEGVEKWKGSLQMAGEGENQWHESPYYIHVTRNEPVTVISRDAWANTRSHTITITNFDEGYPVIDGFTQSNDSWTNQPVRVSVTAYDDHELAAQAYKWDYTLNIENNAIVHPGSWTATPYIDMQDSGRIRVSVRDSVGYVTESAPVDDTSAWYGISNIDKIPLALGSTPYEVSTTDKVAAIQGVTITLNMVDPVDKVTGMSSGLAPTPIKWSSAETTLDWTTAKTVTVHSNGNYVVYLRDAVGNISEYTIPIDNIVTNGPSVLLSGNDVDNRNILSTTWWKGPVTLHANVTWGDVPERDDGLTYSWDGGVTWTDQNTFVATTNGTYMVKVRDRSGTIATDAVQLSRIDSTAPVVGMYLYKGIPDDWEERFGSRECQTKDYVWKLRIVVEDPGAKLNANDPSIGSDLFTIKYQWLGDYTFDMTTIGEATPEAAAHRATIGGTATYDNHIYEHYFDVPKPGTYQVTVMDKAGNIVQTEKVAQWTDLGEGTDGPNPNVPITWPPTGGLPYDEDRGTAGKPYDANLEDLVFGVPDPDNPGSGGVYNIVTGDFKPYPENPGAGIPVEFDATITRNRWGTGYVTYNNQKYYLTFSYKGDDGQASDIRPYQVGPNNTIANGKILGTGNPVRCRAFIPIKDIHQDVKNARIYITINEWDDEGCTQLLKTGTDNVYTSVQVSKPTITYTYNRVTDTMTVVATSALSGIKKVEYQYDAGEWKEYTGPFVIGEPRPTTITLKATDNLNNSTTLPINVADLGLNGSTGGVGSLPQDTLTDGGATSSYHSSNRAADIYIIGGTRGNTDQHPNGTVFDRLLGNNGGGGAPAGGAGDEDTP